MEERHLLKLMVPKYFFSERKNEVIIFSDPFSGGTFLVDDARGKDKTQELSLHRFGLKNSFQMHWKRRVAFKRPLHTQRTKSSFNFEKNQN